MMARLIGDAFVSYYERHLDAVEKRWEKKWKGKWPSVWKFAWAIRNAISHDEIRSTNSPDVGSIQRSQRQAMPKGSPEASSIFQRTALPDA